MVITVIKIAGKSMSDNTPQLFIRPTPAGINITGIISIRNLPASLTDSSFIMPVTNPAKLLKTALNISCLSTSFDTDKKII